MQAITDITGDLRPFNRQISSPSLVSSHAKQSSSGQKINRLPAPRGRVACFPAVIFCPIGTAMPFAY